MHSKSLHELVDLIDRSPLPVTVSRRSGPRGWMSRRGPWSLGLVLVPVMSLIALAWARRRRTADADPDIVPPPGEADLTADSARQGLGAQRDGRAPTPVPGARPH
jgi:hypothetical protein